MQIAITGGAGFVGPWPHDGMHLAFTASSRNGHPSTIDPVESSNYHLGL